MPEVISILSDRQARDADNKSSFSGAFRTLRDVLADWLEPCPSSVIGTQSGSLSPRRVEHRQLHRL